MGGKPLQEPRSRFTPRGSEKVKKDFIRVLTAGLPQVHYAVLGAVEPCLLFDK
jgi:hypothetical protein